MAKTSDKNPNIGKTLELPLKSVTADFEWNCRKLAGEGEVDLKGETEKNDFSQLMASIDSDGQSTPVVVRPRGKDGYFLVSGFRRYAAIQKLAEKNGKKDPVILATVRDLDDLHARAENVRENASRKNVAPTELLVGLLDLRKLAGEKISIQALADMVGVGRPYASRLFKIAETLKAELLSKWIESPTDIGVNRVENVAKVDKDRQEEEWESQTATGGRGAAGGGGTEAWLTAATKAAEKAGEFLGRLQGHDLINSDDLDFFKDLDKVILNVKEDATKEQRKGLADVMAASFVTAQKLAKNPPPPKEPKAKKADKEKGNAEAQPS